MHINIILRTYECAQKTVWESSEIYRMSYTNYRRRARRPMTNACPILIRHYSRAPADPAGTAPDRATCATRPPGAVAGSSARPAQTARVTQRGTLLIYLAVYNTSPLSCTVSPGAIKTACPSIAKVRKNKNYFFLIF